MCVEYPSALILKGLRRNSCLSAIASYVARLCLWKITCLLATNSGRLKIHSFI
jgi:hypothetical protein